MSDPGRRRRHGQGNMSVQMNSRDRRPQGGGKIKRQRIARSLLDLNDIISSRQADIRTPPLGDVYDPLELLEGAIDYIKCIQDIPGPETVETPEDADKMQEAVLPCPVPTTMTSLSTEPTEDAQILAGFRDCTEEVMRYLIEVENLPESHPVCQGLRQHLLERQRLLNVETLLNNCQNQFMYDSSSQSYCPSSVPAESFELVSSQEHQDLLKVSEPSMVSRTVPVVALPPPKIETCSAFNLFDFFPQASSVETMAAPQTDSRLAFIGQNDADQSKSSPSDFRALDLQQLAENNPEIACLTEEILGLLEEDDSDMSVFDDSDCYFDSDIEQ